jgi:hypothetical protein
LLRLICDAIERRRLLRFKYNGLDRTVEPYAHGFSSGRHEVLRGYQTAGQSQSGGPTGWRFFDADKVEHIEVLQTIFRPTRQWHEQAAHDLVVIHCAVEGGDLIDVVNSAAPNSLDLITIVEDFAVGLKRADALSPQAISYRSGKSYRPGIGPHGENAAVQLVLNQMRRIRPTIYVSAGPIPYPKSRLQCDLGIGNPTEWAIEVKMARAFGDNGKLDDTYIKDVLSPYDVDHSAVSDAKKLRTSGFDCRKAVLVYGFAYSGRELQPLLGAFEALARLDGPLGRRVESSFTDLVHPVHAEGLVTGWEVLDAQ